MTDGMADFRYENVADANVLSGHAVAELGAMVAD